MQKLTTVDRERPHRVVHRRGLVRPDLPGPGTVQGPGHAVHFARGAHTAWHSHAVGQTRHVTEGIGLVGTRDGQVIVMRPGDTVYTPPGEWQRPHRKIS